MRARRQKDEAQGRSRERRGRGREENYGLGTRARLHRERAGAGAGRRPRARDARRGDARGDATTRYDTGVERGGGGGVEILDVGREMGEGRIQGRVECERGRRGKEIRRKGGKGGGGEKNNELGMRARSHCGRAGDLN